MVSILVSGISYGKSLHPLAIGIVAQDVGGNFVGVFDVCSEFPFASCAGACF